MPEHYIVIPAKAGIQDPRQQRLPWPPAFAGVTGNVCAVSGQTPTGEAKWGTPL